MKVSVKWLNDYIDLSGISVDELVSKLTTAGLEVDDVFDGSKIYENFVVGIVKKKENHPNADKLTVCTVNDGIEDYKVVCGAPNVAAGQKVPFAKVGAIITNGGFKIKKAKIRGEESYGMICAEDELGLSDDHSGIMVLDQNMEIGKPLAEALGLDDVTIEIDLTPNRADALSHIGIARDLSALLNRPIKIPEIKIEESETPSEDLACVEIENTNNCPRYVGKVVTGVTIQESPEWMKKRLAAIGLRPINNIVDVTNYVCHEVGQPLHAFDLDRLAGKKIVVKDAGENRDFVTLDSKTRKLNAADLMICDAEKQVAIAGVMGGENSEVTSDTKNVLIESAYFNPSSVRKTSKQLGLSTDSSHRFERGVDYGNTAWAARRAAQLICDLSGGKSAKGEIDVYPVAIPNKKVELRFERVGKILGYTIPNETILEIVDKIKFKIIKKDKSKIEVEVPSFRPDIEREIDIIEELARIYGYDNIPDIAKISVTLDEKVDQSDTSNNFREIMSSLGFNEIITNSLLNEETANKFGTPVKVLNPQSVELACTRPSLIPGMLNTISKNIKVRISDLQLYEIGNTFSKLKDGIIKDFSDFYESEHMLLAMTGRESLKEWYSFEREFDIFDLRGAVDEFLSKLSLINLVNENFSEDKTGMFINHFSKLSGKEIIGFGGELNEEYLKYFDIKQPVYFFDFDLTHLKKVTYPVKKFVELLKYPKVVRDFAFILDKEIKTESVEKTIYAASSKLLKNIKLFDIFEGDSLGKGKKSLAFQLEYFDASRTLTEEEVDKDFWNAIEAVKVKLNAVLRG